MKESPFILPASNSLEDNAKLWAEHYNNLIHAGHGLFFDFKATPELEKPALDCLVNSYGWTLEKSFFIRKPVTDDGPENKGEVDNWISSIKTPAWV